MIKTIYIEGMACMHCVASVEKALADTAGVKSVQVSLEDKKAVVEGAELSDEVLSDAVTEIGFEVTNIE